MRTKQSDTGLTLMDLEDFDLQQIFECGQAFRWKKAADGSYVGVVGEKVMTARQKPGLKPAQVDLELEPCTLMEYEMKWKHYFDLNTDYKSIKGQLAVKDQALAKAVVHGGGIRLLNQDLWEMILTFILSANNNIPRIAASIEALSAAYGKNLGTVDGKEWYSLPRPEVLARVKPEELRPMGLGYRDQYVVATSRLLASGEVDLEKLVEMQTPEARKELLKLPGVGPKVAECILLFALGRRDAFPIDTWVKKVMNHFYSNETEALKSMGQFAEQYFGPLAGYAQQYLFYYARENRLGQ